MKVAMKFFGYTANQPNRHEIEKEIDFMVTMSGIQGVPHFFGIITDTKKGYLEEKQFIDSFPIIVMEFLSIDLLSFVISQDDDSDNYCTVEFESDLSKLFESLMISLKSLHDNKFIHNDLKCENIMLLNASSKSCVKIIDYGEMIQFQEGENHVSLSERPPGTIGYFAPESLQSNVLSYRTDLWQAGVILYVLLSGSYPFKYKDNDIDDYMACVTYEDQAFIPMEGTRWANTSEYAKDLVQKMLDGNPMTRISSCDEVLDHPWFTFNDDSLKLTDSYRSRVQKILLRSKMRDFFLANNICYDNEARKHALHPYLMESMNSLGNQCSDVDSLLMQHSRSCDSIQSYELKKCKDYVGVTTPLLTVSLSDESGDNDLEKGFMKAKKKRRISSENLSFADKLQVLKEKMLTAFSADGSRYSSPDCKNSTIHQHRLSRQLDYDSFCTVMRDSDFPELARMTIFKVFDVDKSDTISVREFLLTLLAITPMSKLSESSNEDDAALLYFNMFDLDGSGYIDMEEMHVMAEVLQDNDLNDVDVTTRRVASLSISQQVEELFNEMDSINHDKQIDFNEFRQFYHKILVCTSRGSVNQCRESSNTNILEPVKTLALNKVSKIPSSKSRRKDGQGIAICNKAKKRMKK